MVESTRTGRAKPSKEKPGTTEVSKDPQTRTRPHGDKIAEAAYYRSEKRGFVAGFELQDWLEAEQEINQSRQAD